MHKQWIFPHCLQLWMQNMQKCYNMFGVLDEELQPNKRIMLVRHKTSERQYNRVFLLHWSHFLALNIKEMC